MTRFPLIPKPALTLRREVEVASELFKSCKSIEDVATTLEVHPGHLRHWLYVNPGHAGYSTFDIPKKSHGSRRIAVPPNAIAVLQLKFKNILDHIYQPRSCVFGFVPGRSIVSGASIHRKRAKWVLNIDIKDFYPSINFGRVRGLFIALGVGEKAAAIWAHLVTYNGVLPQGASTSPVISNMIAKSLDGNLLRLATRYHLTYSRYADDLTLSTTKKKFPLEIVTYEGTPLDPVNVEPQHVLVDAVRSAGFEINPRKTRLLPKNVRQEVTGLTVNELVNVRRPFLRQIRAMIHAAGKFGFENAGTEYIEKYASEAVRIDASKREGFRPDAYFKMVVYGKLGFVRMVRGKTDTCYISLCLQMAKIDSDPPRQIQEIKTMHEEFDVFLCHASEDKEGVVIPLFESLKSKGINAFVDIKYIQWGDSFVEKINHALSRAKVVLVVLSSNSVYKKWPTKELNASLAREVDGTIKLLPLIVGSEADAQGFLEKLPLLKDKHYERWEGGPDSVADKISEILKR